LELRSRSVNSVKMTPMLTTSNPSVILYRGVYYVVVASHSEVHRWPLDLNFSSVSEGQVLSVNLATVKKRENKHE